MFRSAAVILVTLSLLFISEAGLAEAAEKYLLAIGLSADEITALKGKLGE